MGGALRRENVGMSNRKSGESPDRRKPEVSSAMSIIGGLGVPKRNPAALLPVYICFFVISRLSNIYDGNFKLKIADILRVKVRLGIVMDGRLIFRPFSPFRRSDGAQ